MHPVTSDQSVDFGIGLIDVFRELLQRPWLYASLGIIGLGLGIVAVLGWPRSYRVQVLVEPVAQSSGGSLASIASSLGGLGSLGGLMLGGNEGAQSAIATLKSRQLAEEYIRANNLLKELFENKWDAAEERWKVKKESEIPSLWDGFRKFDQSIRTVSEDRRSGLVTLAIQWKDRERAAEWANGLIMLANERSRSRAIADASARIELLEAEAKAAQSLDIQAGIFRLIEGEIQRVAVARADPQFAFRIIDPAAPPDADAFVSPKVVLWPLLGLVLGFGTSFAWAILRLLRTPSLPGAAASQDS